MWRKRNDSVDNQLIEPAGERPIAPIFDPETTIYPPIFELTQDLVTADLAATPSERRSGAERRAAFEPLPSHRAGRDRRLLRPHQRKGFGSKANAA